MPKRGENIYKRKDGRWEGRYIKERIEGKIKYGYIFAKSYKEVKNKLLDVIKEKYEENSYGSGGSFGETADIWLNSIKSQLKESSAVKYINLLNTYIFPEFKYRIIADISRNEIYEFAMKLLVCGGKKKNGLSSKTVTNIMSVIRSIFKFASVEMGYSVADIDKIAIKQQQTKMRVLSYSEQQRLSSFLCKNLNSCNLGILVCLYMGLRIGEICALKWEDISFEEHYIYVHKTMQRLQTLSSGKKKTQIIISSPKSDCSIRKIPIPTNIFELLNALKNKADTFLLTGKEKYVEPRTMQNRFKKVLTECNIQDANFHALRHTFATRCVELGFDIKSLSEVLGHASVNITLNRYVHPSMELKQENMNRLSELLAVK